LAVARQLHPCAGWRAGPSVASRRPQRSCHMKLVKALFGTMFSGLLIVGCAASEPEARQDQPRLEQDAQTQEISEALAEGGCSNATIRQAQSECRNWWCVNRGGSRGIHWCNNYNNGNCGYQCDCVSGDDALGLLSC